MFYPLTLAVAATWIAGGLPSGPLHLGYLPFRGSLRRPIATRLVLGLLAGPSRSKRPCVGGIAYCPARSAADPYGRSAHAMRHDRENGMPSQRGVIRDRLTMHDSISTAANHINTLLDVITGNPCKPSAQAST